MFLQQKQKNNKKNPFSNKKKRFTFNKASDVQKNWNDKFQTTGNVQNLNSATHKTYVQSHITRVEPYTVKLTIQITSINTRFNFTIICLYDFPFCCFCQTAQVHIPSSSSVNCRILQCKMISDRRTVAEQ